MKEVNPTSVKAERLQTRASTNSDYIDEIADRMAAGDTFPPIVVFTDGKESWVADGIHRLDGAIKSKTKIGVDERKGTRADAVEYACGANSSHGMRRTNADKRRAVQLALSSFPDRSSRAIAELCGVSNHLVEELRQSAQTSASTGRIPSRTGRDGKKRSQSPMPVEPEIAEEEQDEEPEMAEVVDPDSLEAVQADIRDLEKRCRELARYARSVLKLEGNEVHRPWCGCYSVLTIIHPLTHVARTLLNDLPVGGTAKKPILFHEQKAREAGK